MDYIYGMFGATVSKDESAAKIQSIYKGHLYRKKIRAATTIQKYYKRYNVLRLSQVYRDISTDEVRVSHSGVEYCKGLETDDQELEEIEEEIDDELETVYINKRKQLLKLHRKLLIVKNELRILESGNLPEPKLKIKLS